MRKRKKEKEKEKKKNDNGVLWKECDFLICVSFSEHMMI